VLCLLVLWHLLIYFWLGQLYFLPEKERVMLKSINSHNNSGELGNAVSLNLYIHHTFRVVFSYLFKPAVLKQKLPVAALKSYKSVMSPHKSKHVSFYTKRLSCKDGKVKLSPCLTN
jgi:hypothetical protein